MLYSYRWLLCPSETELLAIFYGAGGAVECVCSHHDRLCEWLKCDCYHSFSVLVIGQVCLHVSVYVHVCVGWQRS